MKIFPAHQKKSDDTALNPNEVGAGPKNPKDPLDPLVVIKGPNQTENTEGTLGTGESGEDGTVNPEDPDQESEPEPEETLEERFRKLADTPIVQTTEDKEKYVDKLNELLGEDSNRFLELELERLKRKQPKNDEDQR